jgi:uncharacterized protein YndB with AHSA1/START domain
MSQDAVQDIKTRDIAVTRVFDAPVETVWRLWTEPALLKRWWGPQSFTCPVAELDFREGGVSLVSMRAPQEYGGQEMFSTWTYTRIVPMERIEYIYHLTDAEGNRLDPAALNLPPDVPEEVRIVVTFVTNNGKTEMTLVHYGMPAGDMSERAEMGYNQSFDKMAKILASL